MFRRIVIASVCLAGTTWPCLAADFDDPGVTVLPAPPALVESPFSPAAESDSGSYPVVRAQHQEVQPVTSWRIGQPSQIVLWPPPTAGNTNSLNGVVNAPVYTPLPPTGPHATVLRPILPLEPLPPNYEVGRGLLGQPKLYVPGQPVRNFLRYLSP
jgi:hypothetical protein